MSVNNGLKKSKIKNIITLNVYDGTKYIFRSNRLQSLQRLSYHTANFISSYLNTKDMIHTTLSVSRSVSETDLLDVIDMKVYDDLGLDEENSYVISPIEIQTKAEDREFHIFVVEPEVLHAHYDEITNETRYIDLIVPAPLLFQTLYMHRIVPSTEVHAFIYFTKKDAFMTFYKHGQYLYSKSMEYTLEKLYETFCTMVSEKIDKTLFFSLLTSEELQRKNPHYAESLIKIFDDIVMTMNDIAQYTKRAFHLENIDHFYSGSTIGTWVGLDRYEEKYLGVKSVALDLSDQIQSSEKSIDQLHHLMVLTTYDYLESPYEKVNLTIYPRSPSFFNRSSGQFIIALALVISLSLIYPLFYLLGAYTNDTKNFILNTQDTTLTTEVNRYKSILKNKKEIIKGLEEKRKNLATQYNAKTKTLEAIYNKKVNYKLKSEIFHTISKELDRFDVKVDTLYSKENTVWISMIGSNERKLTEFIKYVSNKYFKDIAYIDIERIDKNAVTNHYKGLLKVELR